MGDREVAITQLDIVTRSGECIAEYLLEDESIIRVSNVAAVVYRVDDSFDPEGNPLYLVKLGTSVTTVKAPKHNRNQGRKTNGSSSVT